MQGGASTGAPEPAAIVEREGGLHQDLSPRQVAMIGLGSTIGTGLFLGSAISVKLAGPAVILSFLGGSLIALTVMCTNPSTTLSASINNSGVIPAPRPAPPPSDKLV